MPSFSSPPKNSSIKMIYIGHSGAGKTGSLAALAAAGYNVRILDLDNKVEVLRDFIQNPKSIYRHERPPLWTAEQAATIQDRISYVTITESFKIFGGQAVPEGDSWMKINDQLRDWRDEGKSYGNIINWKPNDVLVIDSFSRICEAAMYFQLSLGGDTRLSKGPQAGSRDGNDYSECYKYLGRFLAMLKQDTLPCNVVMVCHISFMSPNYIPQGPGAPKVSGESIRGFPQVWGTQSKLSPQVSQGFPHVIRAKSQGNFPSVRRTIVTNNDENIELITTAPLRVKQEYSLETGLAEYFRDVKGPIQ